MSETNDVRSKIPTLLGDAVEQLGDLIHSEVQLAGAEISEKLARARSGSMYVAFAGMFMIPVLVVLLLTLALWLSQMGLSTVTAHLVAAALGAIVSAALGLIGFGRLKTKGLTPTVTIQQLGKDIATVRKFAK